MNHPAVSVPASLPALVGLLGLAVLAAPVLAAPFTPGNLVVYTVDNGASALNARATPVRLQEFAPGATSARPPVQSISLAASGLNVLTASGTAATDGNLLLSSDGTFLSFGGYNVAPGSTGIPGSVSRIFATVDSAGALSYAAPFPSSGTNFRGVVSASAASGYYLLTGDGFSYRASLNAPVNGVTGSYPVSSAAIFARQLYGSTGAAPTNNGINSLDGGLPQSPAYYRALPGFPNTVNDSPNGFRLLALAHRGVPDTIYLALGRAGGGIQRYNFDGTNWKLAYTLNPSVPVGFYGLTARIDPQDSTKVRLYATTQPGSANGGGNQLVTFTDSATAGNVTSPGPVKPTVLAAANGAQMFRGVDFAPMAAAPAGPPLVTSVQVGPQGATITARGRAGAAYAVQSTWGAKFVWVTLATVWADESGTIQFNDPHPWSTQQIYRLIQVSEP